MTTKPTQKERVLLALQRAGRFGITKVDFQLPNVVDGGPPILHVGGRVLDLREDGHEIVSSGKRDKCTVYKLKSSPAFATGDQARRHAAPAPAAPGHAAGTLFNPAGLGKPLGAYDDIDEAA